MYQVLQEPTPSTTPSSRASPDVQQAADFIATDEEILYMHIIDDATASHIGAFPGRQPVAYEVFSTASRTRRCSPTR